MIHLDTNFLIEALMANSDAQAKVQTWKNLSEELSISSIAWSEFLCGPLTQNEEVLAHLLFPAPEPFLPSDAHKAAQLFNATGRRSRSLADCQIAAVAVRCGAGLATSNLSDFTLFEPHGLKIV